MKLTDEEKQFRYTAINDLSNVLWAKHQLPVSKYKKLSVFQLNYMKDQLMNTNRKVNEVYEDALKLE